MRQYQELLRHVLAKGTRKQNRTGVDTQGVFGYSYKHDTACGFPLLTTKHIKWELIVLENLWFMSGSDKADFLRHYNVKFWEPWTDENGIVANCYGPAWINFPTDKGPNNQIAWALKELRNNPLSRRIVVSSWNPGVAQTAALPPCHALWVLNTQTDRTGALVLNLALMQRSADICLGVPFNLAGYAFLLHVFAKLANLKPGTFAHTMVDAHIYVNHIEGAREQLQRAPLPLPTLRISPDIKELSDIQKIIADRPSIAEIKQLFRLESYESHPHIAYPVAV